jgi:hypothetical protein
MGDAIAKASSLEIPQMDDAIVNAMWPTQWRNYSVLKTQWLLREDRLVCEPLTNIQ